jgi:hypothetical protein
VRSRWITAAAIGTIAWLGLGASASAQNRPYVRTAPGIAGIATVGSTLFSVGGDAGGPGGTTTGRAWLRCNNASDERACRLIDGAWNTNSYALTSADLGKFVRSALFAYRDYPRDLVWKLSPATVAITNPAPQPAPTPAPPPVAAPTPAPVQPVAQALPTEQAQTPALVPVGARPKRMKPFPTVRISGVLTTHGAQISRLSVRAPKRVKVTIKCSGNGCPRRSVSRTTKTRTNHFAQFETYLRSGLKLTITISKKGYLSKVTTIRIRKAKAPLRSDLCRAPGAKKLSRCPKG